MNNIKEFYDTLHFPGQYTVADISEIKNKYLYTINSAIQDHQSVLDVGCGTGLITNFLALRHPTSQFTGIDFSESINVAQKFSRTHGINNASFIQKDFLKFDSQQKYDVVICQGVLHHIPDFQPAALKLSELAQKTLIVGVYHPWGKWVKKYFKVAYHSNMLAKDQESHPFELSFTCNEIIEMFPKFKLCRSYPSHINMISQIEALFNYQNGGLITYIFDREVDK
jgi:2-polyprenyl-3-methyl-5-hydroxy-6-metoxy-1,4-benzoquinol methylase